jgi:hypothetical protein
MSLPGPACSGGKVPTQERLVRAEPCVGAKLYSGRDGALRVLVLRAPSGSSVYSFDTHNTVSLAPQNLPASASILTS